MAYFKRLLQQIPGRAYLILAVIIFATSNSVTRRLIQLGAANLVEGENPISFCNILFAGNVVALTALVTVYRQQIRLEAWRKLTPKSWVGLNLVGILSGAIAPALFLLALNLTSVNSLILIGRIEPPLTLALSVLFLKERVNFWVVLGAVFAFGGVALTLFLQQAGADAVQMAGFMVGKGELCALGGAIATALGTLISKASLKQVGIGLFSIYRTIIGTIVFLVTVLALFGAEHFIGVFSPIIWRWMLVYGIVIVVGGQLCWLMGLQRTTASEVSLASSFSPIIGILMAYLILAEVPTAAQYMGGTIILVGIALNQMGTLRKRFPKPRISSADGAQAMETNIGYKGV
ncbi:MAG: DMT family transporter [Synechococcales bacterium]|nr:DMT family transporter [Synechococcales bacterium]